MIEVPEPWQSLRFPTHGSKTYIPKKIIKLGVENVYTKKNYTKTTCRTLLSEKFGRGNYKTEGSNMYMPKKIYTRTIYRRY
ncbi:hypothetical protein HanIR_Chr06g0263821 [Helianthus annuus]|nr:hypothetical protein HanIR_Chr06g0263821 [Helianthus annuus]